MTVSVGTAWATWDGAMATDRMATTLASIAPSSRGARRETTDPRERAGGRATRRDIAAHELSATDLFIVMPPRQM